MVWQRSADCPLPPVTAPALLTPKTDPNLSERNWGQVLNEMCSVLCWSAGVVFHNGKHKNHEMKFDKKIVYVL